MVVLDAAQYRPDEETGRSGWSTFEAAPKIDEFEPGVEARAPEAPITPPRRSGKPRGASIHVPQGDWRKNRDRDL